MHDEHTERVDLTQPIGVLRLSMRTINALRAVRIWTLGQLVGITARKLLPGLGIERRAVGEIERALQAHGMLSKVGSEGGRSGKDNAQRVKHATVSDVRAGITSAGRELARRARARPPAFAQTQDGGARQPTERRAPEGARRAEVGSRGMRISDPHAVESRETTARTNLSRRQDEAPRRMAPERSAASKDAHWQGTKNEVRLYRVIDRWSVRLEVTGKMLRGGRRALPGVVGSAIGCQPGGTRTFRSPADRVVVSWTDEGASGPYLGPIDQDLRAIDAREGDLVFLVFKEDDVELSLLRAEELRPSKPSVMVARLVGLPAEMASHANPWRAIGTAVGIPLSQARVTSSDVYASLMRRGEQSLANVVRKATADKEVSILDQLEGILGL